MTIQVQHTLRRLIAIHGCSAMLVRHMGEGIGLYSIGGVYYYRIRGMVRYCERKPLWRKHLRLLGPAPLDVSAITPSAYAH